MYFNGYLLYTGVYIIIDNALMPKPIWWILRVFHHVLLFNWGYTSVYVRCGRKCSARNGLLFPQGWQCSVKFVTPL